MVRAYGAGLSLYSLCGQSKASVTDRDDWPAFFFFCSSERELRSVVRISRIVVEKSYNLLYNPNFLLSLPN